MPYLTLRHTLRGGRPIFASVPLHRPGTLCKEGMKKAVPINALFKFSTIFDGCQVVAEDFSAAGSSNPCRKRVRVSTRPRG